MYAYKYSVGGVLVDCETLGKLTGLLLLFCLALLLLSINLHTKNTRNELSSPVMGTIFLVVILVVSKVAIRTVSRAIRLAVT